ncbi:MAG: DUF2161 family putative PD-(D/E)XK-type phosphodiesterase [candidate division WOR-3 bacterium]
MRQRGRSSENNQQDTFVRKSKPAPITETSLYGPVRDFLVAQGFTVRAEVSGCDIAASREDGLVIIELKRNFGVDLLFQATERQRITDAVYIALPLPPEGFTRSRWRIMSRLLRRLELGLILVSMMPGQPRVEVVMHPEPFERRKSRRLKTALLDEMGGRSGDFNLGGSTRRKLVTAYRENVIYIACCLERFGPLSPKQLRNMGTGPKTLSILRNNFYGWFRRVSRGVYELSQKGREEISQYPVLVSYYRSELEKL